MTKVIIGILIALVLAAVYGFAFGIESWSDTQAWVLLGVVFVVLGGWALGVWITRNEGPRKQ